MNIGTKMKGNYNISKKETYAIIIIIIIWYN